MFFIIDGEVEFSVNFEQEKFNDIKYKEVSHDLGINKNHLIKRYTEFR